MAKQWDSGSATISAAKSSQAQSFNVTFSSAPQVFATMGGSTAAKGSGATNITTTGFDIYGEAAELAHWVARDAGYEDAGAALALITAALSENGDTTVFQIKNIAKITFSASENGDASAFALKSIAKITAYLPEIGDAQAFDIGVLAKISASNQEDVDPQTFDMSYIQTAALTAIKTEAAETINFDMAVGVASKITSSQVELGDNMRFAFAIGKVIKKLIKRTRLRYRINTSND